jgi:tetratricopeptide (TPR) repeat protein
MTATGDSHREDSFPSDGTSPSSSRVNPGDVLTIEAVTRVLREQDYHYGGGTCEESATTYLIGARKLLSVPADDEVSRRLAVAIADLHNLAGWASFDVGRIAQARLQFALARELAAQAGNDLLEANICYRLGRVYLHHNASGQARTEFQRGLSAAAKAGSPLAAAILHANQAWASATLGDSREASAQLGRAEDEFARADVANAPGWAAFFTATDLSAMIGTVHATLAWGGAPGHARQAIPALAGAIAGYGPDMARSRAFMLATLAAVHVRDGDIEYGISIGDEAIALGRTVKSRRVADRLRPLHDATARLRNPAAREMTTQIRALRASA